MWAEFVRLGARIFVGVETQAKFERLSGPEEQI